MTIKTLIKMFEDRRDKLSAILRDSIGLGEARKSRIEGSIDEIEFLLRTLKQQEERIILNRPLGIPSQDHMVFCAEDMINPEEPMVKTIDEKIPPDTIIKKDEEKRPPPTTYIG